MDDSSSYSGALVLHVPYTWFPDPCGGTEVYVRSLASRLASLGFPSVIAAPGTDGLSYERDGLAVRRFGSDNSAGRELAWGVPDRVAAASFRVIAEELRPAIVHLHARTSAVSELLVGVARDVGARVVFTYHTPTATCARGTMMLNGAEPCDGRLEKHRCSACVLQKLGLPQSLAAIASNVPEALSFSLAESRGFARPLFALAVPGLVGRGHRHSRRFLGGVDHVVAVCDWVRDVLLRNGVPLEKLTLSRQGIEDRREASPTRAFTAHEPLRLAYFGRIDASKGPDLVVRALALAPDAKATLDVFAIREAGENPLFEWLVERARADQRIRILPAVTPDSVTRIMADYDMIVIPSRWLETGPLVALEAFAAGTPVLGARLGGIVELVSHGIDGVLVAPDDPAAWATAITGLAASPEKIATMRAEIQPSRLIDDCAADMINIYNKLIRANATAKS